MYMENEGKEPNVKKVVATGVFSILHPGHLLFLREAKKLGDELTVIVATDKTVKNRKNFGIIPGEQRLEIIKSLKVVDTAIMGDDDNMFVPIARIRPDIIALGEDQHFDENELQMELKKRGLKTRIVRIKKTWEGELNSSKKIIEKIMTYKG